MQSKQYFANKTKQTGAYYLGLDMLSLDTLAYINKYPGQTEKSIAEDTTFRPWEVKKAIKELEEQGLIKGVT